MDGSEYQYSSGDKNNDDDEDNAVVKNKRGKGRAWQPIRVHANIEAAKRTIDGTRKPGRINRGRTIAFYYFCEFKSCGCKVQWRYVTSQISYEVAEEQSDGVHTCHDLLQRNGGRGLSFAQVEILEDAVELRILKPLSIVLYYENTARALLENG